MSNTNTLEYQQYLAIKQLELDAKVSNLASEGASEEAIDKFKATFEQGYPSFEAHLHAHQAKAALLAPWLRDALNG